MPAAVCFPNHSRFSPADGLQGYPGNGHFTFSHSFSFLPHGKRAEPFQLRRTLPRAWFLSMKTGQPTAPRKESWGSRKAPVYMKKAPEENLRVLLWQSPVGERSPAPTAMFLCLCDRGRRHIKKRQKARLSDAAIRDTIIALGNGDTLHKYYTMPSMGMQAKSKRKGMCIQPVPTDGRERAGQPFPCLLKSDSICPLNAPSPIGTSVP